MTTTNGAPAGVAIDWCGAFAAAEVDELYVDMRQPSPLVDGTMPRYRLLDDYGWHRMLDEHAVGWVVARDDHGLVGFAQVAAGGTGDLQLLDRLVARRMDGRSLLAAMVERCEAEVGAPVRISA